MRSAKTMLALAAMTAVLASACGTSAPQSPQSSGSQAAPRSDAPTASAAGPAKGGSLTLAQDSDPASLNPLVTQDYRTYHITNQVYETLVGYDADFKPAPRLATSWTISDDAMTYEFELAEGVTWHDGQPFTSEDVKFTFEVVGPELSPSYGAIFGALESVDATDPNRVVLHFSAPNATLMSFLGDPTTSILPKHVFDGTDVETNPASSAPVGTGPFKFGEWVSGDHVSLVRNESYRDPARPYLDQINFRIVPDATSRVQALLNGDIDAVLWTIPPAEAARLSAAGGIEVLSPSVAARIFGLAQNLRNSPVSDLAVRQAISLAADRNRMVEQVSFGTGRPARAPIASTSVYFDTSLPELARDVDAANALLDGAGYARQGDGTRFTLRLPVAANQVQFQSTAQILKENLADVGINVEIESALDTVVLDQIFKNYDFDIAVDSASMGPEPVGPWTNRFGTKGIDGAYYHNASGYSNPEFDALLEEAGRTVDVAARTGLYHEGQAMILADLPVVPLWEPSILSAYRTTIGDFFQQPDDRYINFVNTYQQ